MAEDTQNKPVEDESYSDLDIDPIPGSREEDQRLANAVADAIEKRRQNFMEIYGREYRRSLTTQLFAQAISATNTKAPQELEVIAKACRERAELTTPYLLRELGLLPKETT